MRNPLAYRSPELVAAILAAVYGQTDLEEADADPVPWTDIVDAFTSPTHEYKTVDNTLRDLCAFGALHKVGKYVGPRRPDTRAVLPTVLGRAWLAQELHPLPEILHPERTTP